MRRVTPQHKAIEAPAEDKSPAPSRGTDSDEEHERGMERWAAWQLVMARRCGRPITGEAHAGLGHGNGH